MFYLFLFTFRKCPQNKKRDKNNIKIEERREKKSPAETKLILKVYIEPVVIRVDEYQNNKHSEI